MAQKRIKNKRSVIEEGVLVDQVWPCSTKKLSGIWLRSMDEVDFRELRRRVVKRVIGRGGTKGFAKRLSRRLVIRRHPRDVGNVPSDMLARRYRKSQILDSLCPKREKNWMQPIKRRENSEITLKNFSFIDHPNHTMSQLARLAEAECFMREAYVHFEDNQVLDIGPYLVWGLMAQDMLPFVEGGRISRPIKRVVEAVDLRRFMGMARVGDWSKSPDVWAFPLRRRRKADASTEKNLACRPSTREKVSDDLVETIEEWLNALDPPFSLEKEGQAWITNMIGEVLDNAERHSVPSRDGDWYVAGFMARMRGKEGKVDHICHLAFVSIGMTISESLSLSEDEYIKEDMGNYCRKHESYFKGRTVELLSTVFALQDGVSRLPQDESKGGVGIMDIVDLANEIGGTADGAHPSHVTIISGRACIQFRDVYSVGGNVKGDGRRQQWFNPTNSLASPPDPTHVFSLEHRFPGTMIAVRFALDPRFLDEKADEHTDD